MSTTPTAETMADFQAILDEEFEVLESIFPDELEKISDNVIRIRVEPEDEVKDHPLTLNLVVTYPPTYPDVIPELAFETIEEELGALRDGEEEEIVKQLNEVAEESLGMAMTFTIATSAREALSATVAARVQREHDESEARHKAYEEAEAAKKRGTPLTRDSYLKWREVFRKELAAKRVKAEEERVRALPAREREDWRRRKERPSGRQLFETGKADLSADAGMDDGEAVDLSQYSREERDRERWAEEEGAGGLELVDSDDEK